MYRLVTNKTFDEIYNKYLKEVINSRVEKVFNDAHADIDNVISHLNNEIESIFDNKKKSIFLELIVQNSISDEDKLTESGEKFRYRNFDIEEEKINEIKNLNVSKEEKLKLVREILQGIPMDENKIIEEFKKYVKEKMVEKVNKLHKKTSKVIESEMSF